MLNFDTFEKFDMQHLSALRFDIYHLSFQTLGFGIYYKKKITSGSKIFSYVLIFLVSANSTMRRR